MEPAWPALLTHSYSRQCRAIHEAGRLKHLIPSTRSLSDREFARKINFTVQVLLWTPAEIVLKNPLGLMKLDYALAVADKAT